MSYPTTNQYIRGLDLLMHSNCRYSPLLLHLLFLAMPLMLGSTVEIGALTRQERQSGSRTAHSLHSCRHWRWRWRRHRGQWRWDDHIRVASCQYNVIQTATDSQHCY